MTMPAEDGVSLLGQVIATQTEIKIQLAVISEQLRSVPDHEQRLRSLERWRWSLPASALAAVASGVAAWVTYLHR